MSALAAVGGIGYVQVGYVVALGGIALYALSLVLRQRTIARRLPPLDHDGHRPGAPRATPSAPLGGGGEVPRRETSGHDDGGERPSDGEPAGAGAGT